MTALVWDLLMSHSLMSGLAVNEQKHHHQPPVPYPQPNKMYTKPVDVNQSHKFGMKSGRLGVNYDSLPWSDFFDSQELIDGRVPVYIAGTQGHVFLCMHGAGHSALSFAALAKHLKTDSTVVAFDFRGHGANTTPNPTDLSENTLVEDALEAIRYTAQRFPDQSIMIVGHSMGGSIATKSASKALADHKDEEWSKHIQGLYVIDVVEGSAMDALPFMENIVLSRPQEFKTIQQVVQYGVKSGTIKDIESAKVSMPDQVLQVHDQATGADRFVWKTDLLASKAYWEDWFRGLTQCFLNVRVPKQLLLASSDRMDKDLTIAQMQGKFKLVVIENVGHVIHEDKPRQVADTFRQFLQQFRIPPKFADQMVVTSISGKKIVINH